jgi:hypothetical protein
VIVDAIAQGMILSQKVAHLADRTPDRHELRGEPHLGLRDAADQVSRQVVESLVGTVEALVRLLGFLAYALQDLDRQVGRLHRRLPEYGAEGEQGREDAPEALLEKVVGALEKVREGRLQMREKLGIRPKKRKAR